MGHQPPATMHAWPDGHGPRLLVNANVSGRCQRFRQVPTFPAGANVSGRCQSFATHCRGFGRVRAGGGAICVCVLGRMGGD